MRAVSDTSGVESQSELELILLIISADPEVTVSKLTRLETIGPYKLLAERSLSLHDIYLDTTSHALGKKRINLRIRGIGDSYWITMKTSPGLFSRRRHERQEVEIPWSVDSLRKIVAELAGKGIHLGFPENLDETVSRLDIMKRMGLSILQDRETVRVPRTVIDTAASGEILAELEVDSVMYHFARGDVRLFEIELEAKSKKGRNVLGELSDALLADFRAELRSWRFGKLVTGEKLERLLTKGSLTSFMKGDRLKPEAFASIERA